MNIVEQTVAWLEPYIRKKDFIPKEGDSAVNRLAYRRLQRKRRVYLHKKNQQRRMDALQHAARVEWMLEEHGTLWVERFKRDFQHVESTTLHEFASHDAYFAWRRRQLSMPRMRCRFRLLTPRQADEWTAWSRDRILEAHENGHRHRVQG